MKIIGIDPGTAIVGYGIIEYKNNKYNVIDYGCIYTDKDLKMSKRIRQIYDELELILKLHKPDFMAVEELFYFKNNKTIISVGQARGVIVLCGEKNNIEVTGYTPLQVKMGITGYGKSDKKQVQEMVKRVLALDEIPKPDDAADALAIAVTHINSCLSSSRMAIGCAPSKKEGAQKKIKNSKMSAKEFRSMYLK